FYLEVIDLTYILFEIELRLLLTSKAGEKKLPLPKLKIDNQKYLMNLANLAKDNKFLDYKLWREIKKFNDFRSSAIHGLAQGKISYPDLKNICDSTTNIIYDIQSCWLKITIGKEETLED
ncbi:MAG: hypothetical protein WCZ99_03230, partial [Candidatus Paceibacterota bacterium]